MRLRSTLAALAISGLATTTAQAADLPSMKGPPLAPIYAFTWTGFYIGANVGWGFVDSDVVGVHDNVGVVFGAPTFLGNFGSLDGDGVTLGVQAGYNWQVGGWVFGVEGDINWADINSGFTGGFSSRFPAIGPVAASSDIEWFGTIRGRIGYAFDRFLIYGTAGFAFTDVSYAVAYGGPGGPVAGSSSDLRTGWTAGGGVEWAFANNWSAKVEYLYVDTGKNEIFDTTNTFSTFETQSFHLVRLGINYRFY
jgi:outer membrane immunogenic protein